MTLPSLPDLSNGPVIDTSSDLASASKLVNELIIRASSIESKVETLSGGTQQKVVLAKWLLTDSRVLIFDEPTRGVDVGAKVEIYKLINSIAAQGVAVLIITSELPEALGM